MATTSDRTQTGFSEAERAAMKERAEELRASGRGGKKKASDAEAMLTKIAEMPDGERVLAERLLAIVTEAAPDLLPKTWYGMPAWAEADGKIVCFFQGASKFEARYSTFGFNDPANLDDGTVWPTSFAVTDLTDADVAFFTELVRRAVA
ncbi:iron chaperone [Nocardioides sp. SYSU D00038]|uniref:iron chaperone n=1 Tax=Nocardioides sp. SYSU D00038 TaxID=2812554 RepID=UPI0019676FEF|nr:DUF1801 domain-containing protein [Nocardioides sp. SYSU D00038]